MRLLHTSDWHLGANLHGQKRYEEQQAFLDWLAGIIRREAVDVLAVAGDIFDSTAPSNRAQELYYRFLWQAAGGGCRHMVVTGGNHDSPSLLNAPRELLRVMNIYVIGSALEDPADEALALSGPDGDAGLVVCAVPYLRDRDLRVAAAGETPEEKEYKLLEGINRHYQKVCARAEDLRDDLEAAGGREVPIVAMGHLFAAGGRAGEGEGVRELYVGSLARVENSSFPACIDYLALGHLHSPQRLGGMEHRRYSGAPMAMNFGERGSKSLCLVDFEGRQPRVRTMAVPVFQPLLRLVGGLEELLAAIADCRTANSRAWIEAVYTGGDPPGNLRDLLDEAAAGSDLKVLTIRNQRLLGQLRLHNSGSEQLEDLDPVDVFRRCLDQRQVPEEQRPGLMAAYLEVLQSVYDEDGNAE